MSCPGLQSLLRYSYGEADPADSASLQGHLGTCARCREEVEMIRTIDEALAGAERIAPGDGVAAEPCPPAELLAAYVEHSLSGSEREQIERHLVRCQECLEQHARATEWLDAAQERSRPLPSRLREQALALDPRLERGRGGFVGHARRAAETVAEMIRLAFARPRWALVAVPVLAVLVLFLVLKAPEQGPPGQQAGPVPDRGPTGTLPAGERVKVLENTVVLLSPELRQALLAYHGQPTAEARAALLRTLALGGLKAAPGRIKELDIEESLLAKLRRAPDAVREIRVRVLEGDLVVVGES
jgi:anti-sigma factor RsiW